MDEAAGERDVEKYVIYRRTAGRAAFDDALQSVPAGQASYTFDDASVLNDSTYIFGVTALDCTPARIDRRPRRGDHHPAPFREDHRA